MVRLLSVYAEFEIGLDLTDAGAVGLLRHNIFFPKLRILVPAEHPDPIVRPEWKHEEDGGGPP